MRLSLGRSSLYGARLRAEGLDVEIIWPERAGLLTIDDTWPLDRPPGAPYAEWRWEPELRSTDERFGLQGREDALEVVWALTRPPPHFDGFRWYRLSVIEVAPHRQGTGVGTAAMCAVAKRARELDLEGIIVESLPSATGFYLALGAYAPNQREFRSWRVSRKLVRLVFDRGAVDELIEVYDELCSSCAQP